MTDAGKTLLICPLTATTPEAMLSEASEAAREGADTVELRLDFLSPPPTRGQLAALLAGCPVPAIATCRPQRQGGVFEGEEPRRLELLRAAAELGATYVDVELDVRPADWPAPPPRVILSEHDFGGCPECLDRVASEMDASAAAVNKIAFTPAGPEDCFRAFEIARACRKPTLAIAMGESGQMSRILAPKFGLFGTFASLRPGAGSAPGQLTLRQMRRMYRWDAVGPATAVYGVIGFPVGHSMSPAIHNAAFEAAGLDAVYVPLLIQPGAGPFGRFMDAVIERHWADLRGLSVTLPHKENALAYVDAADCDELTLQIGALNTLAFGVNGHLQGANTDYAAALDSLCAGLGVPREGLAGMPVGILGAGGVARAVVAALVHYGAEVTVYNRTVERAQRLAAEFACRADALGRATRGGDQVLINCTPIGMHPNTAASPVEWIPTAAGTVFDTVYNPIETRMLRMAREAGRKTISGVEMFVNQAAGQFEAWTGQAAPRDVMRQVVLQRLREQGAAD